MEIVSENNSDDYVAISKIFEFSPSGLTTQNNMMIVLPLDPCHRYDYENLTLMYRHDCSSQFVSADSLQTNKPEWMFDGDKCYLFTNHFCEYLIKMTKYDKNGL